MGKKRKGSKSLPYGEEDERVVSLFPTGKKRKGSSKSLPYGEVVVVVAVYFPLSPLFSSKT